MLRHVAIIMDGNGRWASARHLPRTAGHKKGADAARKVIEAAADSNVQFLTLYAFSSENWKRPEQEVKELMNLLRFYLGSELSSLHKNNIRIKVIGDVSKLDLDIQQKILEAEKLTQANSALQLNIALSYGSRQEIIKAALAMEGNEGDFEAHLYTYQIPDPDLLIRTGGEQRLSNFLLWQLAYTELYFTDTLWPDFDEKQFEEAIAEFHRRERRFGGAGRIKTLSQTKAAS